MECLKGRSMSELEQFADTLRRSFEGDSWQGDSLSDLLRGLTAQQARMRPLQNVHSIWELVLHIIAWHGVVLQRIAGEAVMPEGEANFPEPGATDAEWNETLERLRKSTVQLADTIRRFDPNRLDDRVPGKEYAYRHMLCGVATHNAYHAGQIALLKKALSAHRAPTSL